MRHLMGFLRQGLIVEIAGRFRVEGEVELVFPAEIEPRTGDRIVAHLRGRMAFSEICCVSRKLIGDNTHLHIIPVRQTQMLFGRYITQHRRTKPADHGCTNARRNMIIAGRNIGGERPQRIERSFAAFLQLFFHVHFDLVHGHVARPFDHHLTAMVPGHFR